MMKKFWSLYMVKVWKKLCLVGVPAPQHSMRYLLKIWFLFLKDKKVKLIYFQEVWNPYSYSYPIPVLSCFPFSYPILFCINFREDLIGKISCSQDLVQVYLKHFHGLNHLLTLALPWRSRRWGGLYVCAKFELKFGYYP